MHDWCRGDLPEHVAEAFEAQKQAVDGLQRPLAALAEQLDAPLPALPESAAQLTATSGISVIVPKVLLLQNQHRTRAYKHVGSGVC